MEHDKFVTAAKANHWGNSNLREYSNGVTNEDDTLPLNISKTTYEALANDTFPKLFEKTK